MNNTPYISLRTIALVEAWANATGLSVDRIISEAVSEWVTAHSQPESV